MLRRWAVAQPVECYADDVLGLPGLGGWNLRDANNHLDDVADGHVRAHRAAFLGALEQRLARGEQHDAAGHEERRILLQVVEELAGQRLLRRDVADEALEPTAERLPWV